MLEANELIDSCRVSHSGRFVQLRPLTVDDSPITLEWRLGDRAVLMNSGATTLREQRDWISSRRADELNFIIELAMGPPVGMIALVDIDLEARTAEPARFLIGEQELSRGRPVAAEATSILYEIAFNRLGLDTLRGSIVAENALMMKWQLYLGMREDGEARSPALVKGQVYETLGVRLTRADYESITRPKLRSLMVLAEMTSSREETQE